MTSKPTLLTRLKNVYVPTTQVSEMTSRSQFLERNRGVLNKNATDLDLYFRRVGSVHPSALSLVSETIVLPEYAIEPKLRTAVQWLFATHAGYKEVVQQIDLMRRNVRAHAAVVSFDRNIVTMRSLHEIDSIVLQASAAFYNIEQAQPSKTYRANNAQYSGKSFTR